MSLNIPYDVASTKETDDPTKANAAIKQVIETGKAIVLQAPGDDPEPILTDYQYTMDMDELNKRYQIFLKDAGTRKVKDGLIKITPKVVEKIKVNIKKTKIKKTEIKKS